MIVQDVFCVTQHPVLEELVGAKGKGIALGVVGNDFLVVDDWDGAEFLASSEKRRAERYDT